MGWGGQVVVGLFLALHLDMPQGHQDPRRLRGCRPALSKQKSNTLPARLIQISPPLIFLDFSGPIQAVPRPSQVFRILLSQCRWTLRRHQDSVFEMGSLCQRRSHQVSAAAHHRRGSRTEASASPVFDNPLHTTPDDRRCLIGESGATVDRWLRPTRGGEAGRQTARLYEPILAMTRPMPAQFRKPLLCGLHALRFVDSGAEWSYVTWGSRLLRRPARNWRCSCGA